jgi:hypothetical protein
MRLDLESELNSVGSDGDGQFPAEVVVLDIQAQLAVLNTEILLESIKP